MEHLSAQSPQPSAAIGVLLPTRDVVATGGDVSTTLSIARAAEDLGYDSVWAGDSVVARPRLDPLTTLAAVAGCTRDILLGTAVLIGPLRHPVLLAHSTATIQALSHGRLILGLGAGPDYGPTKKEYAAVGVPFEGRFERLLRTVDICHDLWSGRSVHHSDQYFSIPKAAIEPTPVDVPVWLGSGSPPGLRAAAEHFQGWLPMPRSIEHFRAGLGTLRQAGTDAGRPEATAIGCYLTVAITDGSSRDFTTGARNALEAYYGQPWPVISSLSDTFVGSADEAAAWVGGYIAAGAQHTVLRTLGPGPERQMRALSHHLDAWRSIRVATAHG